MSTVGCISRWPTRINRYRFTSKLIPPIMLHLLVEPRKLSTRRLTQHDRYSAGWAHGGARRNDFNAERAKDAEHSWKKTSAGSAVSACRSVSAASARNSAARRDVDGDES